MQKLLKFIENCKPDELTDVLKEIDKKTLNSFQVNDKESLLHYAIRFCDKKIIEILVQAGMDVNITDDNDYSILELLSFYNDKESIEFCIDQGAKILHKEGYTPLHWCATYNEIGLLKKILANNKDVDINAKDFAEHENKDRTPLHWSAQEGHTQLAQVLLENGADINMKDINGQTALSIAASEGHKDFVHMLLKYNADKTLKDYNGHTAKDYAEAYQYFLISKLL